MGQALYRKYRSRSLGEIVGQAHVTDTLKKAVASGRISHAYLFTGPRGVGKTSIARILAHDINSLPYSDDAAHIDIIEIDAASNRGIDEIRELREKVYVAPAVGKYKVYIIDEVHMLTTQAFNALLKTLEEPPAHVVFILATTEVHKLPATIISRTQRYTFRPAQVQDIVAHLKHIAAEEKFTIDDDALQAIAEHGDGSFRDSVGLLDQAAQSGKKITLQSVQQLLGIPSEQHITELLAHLQTGDIAGLAKTLTDLQTQGFQAAAIAKHVGRLLRAELINAQPLHLPAAQTIALLKDLLQVATSPDPARLLELVLLSHVDTAALPAAAVASANEPAAAKPADRPKKAAAPAAETQPAAPPKQPSRPKSGGGPVPDTVWPDVLQEIKKRYNTLYSILRLAQTDFTSDGLTLGFTFPFHQKRINEAKNKKIVVDVIEQLTGQAIELTCVVQEKPSPSAAGNDTSEPSAAASPSQDNLKSVSNIFGGVELL